MWGRGWGWGVNVKEALDADLDAYLDRELYQQPTSEVRAAPKVEKPTEQLQGVLALAAEEEQWLCAKPPVEPLAESSQDLDEVTCEIPAHLRVETEPGVSPEPPVEPALLEAPWAQLSEPLPGLALAPHLAPQTVNAPAAPSRTSWLVMSALTGVSAASALIAATLWMTRDTLPDTAQVMAAYAPAGSVAAVAVVPSTPASEPVLSVKDSPLARQPEKPVTGRGAGEAQAAASPEPKSPVQAAAIAHAVPVPAPVSVPALAAAVSGDKANASAAKNPVPVKAETLKPQDKVPVRKVAVEQAQPPRRQLEDPTLEDAEEEELPVLQAPPAAHAPAVAKAEPPPAAPSKPAEPAELEEDFAGKMGFTSDAVRKRPAPVAVKSVWVPPDPDASLPETLSPGEIQQVVIASQPAISECIQQHKEAVPGVSGGKFMVRWFILPSGSTQQAAMETKALKGTALATCIEEVVRGWKFPKHRTQMGAIRFPFIF